jgi:hypothetical protein
MKSDLQSTAEKIKSFFRGYRQSDCGADTVCTASVQAGWSQVGEQNQVGFPVIQQLCLHIPAATFANQHDGDQLAITTVRSWPWACEQRGNLLPDIVDDDKNVQAEILLLG